MGEKRKKTGVRKKARKGGGGGGGEVNLLNFAQSMLRSIRFASRAARERKSQKIIEKQPKRPSLFASHLFLRIDKSCLKLFLESDTRQDMSNNAF